MPVLAPFGSPYDPHINPGTKGPALLHLVIKPFFGLLILSLEEYLKTALTFYFILKFFIFELGVGMIIIIERLKVSFN